MTELTDTDLTRVAHAFGFKDQEMRLAGGLPVLVPEDKKAFCTITPDVVWFEVQSYIAVTDGNYVKGEKIPSKWIPSPDTEGLYVYPFTIPEASFVATEINGLPEHVFLFPEVPSFNLDEVVARLAEHRSKHPSKGFGDYDPYN